MDGITGLFSKAENLVTGGFSATVSSADSLIRSGVGGITQSFQNVVSEATTGAVNFSVDTVNGAKQLLADATADVDGPLIDLEPETSPFQFNSLQYPIGDLLIRYPYYVTFHFNVPTTRSKFLSQYQGITVTEDGKFINANGTATSREENRTAGGSAQVQAVEFGNEKKAGIDLTRETIRTSHSIRLYMPDTLQWNFRQQWRDPHLSDSGLINKLAPALSIAQGYAEGGMSGAVTGGAKALTQLLAKAGDSLLGLPDGVALSSMGYTVNPLIDVIYTSPDLRTFTMEFNFAPRSAQEALEVRKIIRAFKFFSAPEVPKISGYGYLMIPPGDIDIVFSIKTIGRISTCVLQNIDLDYAPNGFAAYQNPADLNDGMPVNIRMRLEFTETEYITKDLVLRGY
jgi:hypothetical protein